jgi:hypothetical protein
MTSVVATINWVDLEKPIDLGPLPYETNKTVAVRIPKDSLPSQATQMLVYVYSEIGATPGAPDGGGDYKISVNTSSTQTATAYLRAHPYYNNSAWVTTSMDIWLPVPFDNEVNLTWTGTTYQGAYSKVQIIAYQGVPQQG